MNKQKPQPEATASPLWELDNVTHINIHYKQARSELGKMLAPFSVYPFTHSFYGPFKTMEGFWHWLRSGGVDDKFRSLNGHRARERMKEGIRQGLYEKANIPDINRIVFLAHYQKIAQHPEIKKALIESTLPFDQYYVFGPGNILIRPDDTDHLVAMFEELRTMFKDDTEPGAYAYPRLAVKK